MAETVIALEDPRTEDVQRLLNRHLAFAHAHSAPDEVFALDVDGLLDPAVSFFGLRVDGRLLAVGALKHLDTGHAELKSMHTADDARGRGLGRILLTFLINRARERRYERISLETGSEPAFAPARSLYERAGFAPCPPFGDYEHSQGSVCMTMQLDSDAPNHR